MENTGNKSEVLTLQATFPINVYYEDTDFSGYVYHANYLKYYERARSNMIGLKLLKEMYANGFHYVVSQANLNYKKPALFGDELVVRSHASCTTSPTLLFEQSIWRENMEIASATIKLVGVNNLGRPIAHPSFVIDAYRDLIKKSKN